MRKKLRGHVIPNSHIDREWTLDFPKSRSLTVKLLDRLLEIFPKVPEYTFLLDSQTIPLEDYLAIRPQNEEALKKYVRAGRLNIGPWYTAPDCNTLSGESIVRNLLIGHRTAKHFGGVMRVGYSPFGFGQVSQLPQIYAGFGIDFIFFYRGITEYESPKAEFVWEGADGTRALCSRFGARSRYNFFMEVWRPVVFGGGMFDRIFDWAKGGVPFKRSGAPYEYEHYFIQRPHLEIAGERIEPAFRKMLSLELPHYTTHVIPLMQGMDTTMPDELEAELVRRLQKYLAPGEEVFFSTLPAYVKELKRALKGKKLKVLTGEMRRPGAPSPIVTNLEHTLSARVRQKVKQARAATALQRLAEPLATLLYILGEPYPKSYLDLAWRYLLQCHPHDTVAGCGLDQLERDSHYRLEQVLGISNVVIDEALGQLQARIDNRSVAKGEIVITIFNPSPHKRTEIVEAFIDTPHSLDIPDFTLTDANGKPVRWSFVYRKPSEKTVRNNADLTMALVGWMVKLHIAAENIPPFGYRTYILRRGEIPGAKECIAHSATRLENEFLRIDFNGDGTLDITEKESERRYCGLHYFEDSGEAGTAWESRPPAIDRIISSKGCPVEISLEENTPLSATVRVLYRMQIPSGLIYNDTHHYSRRGDKEVDLEIETFFTLRAGARRLDCVTRFENRAKNHRLRVFFPSGISSAEFSAAETPFDVVLRPIERGPEHPYSKARNPQYPCLRFADVADEENGLAILTEGLHEYEATDDEERAIAITLLRSFEVTLCTVSYRWERRPDQELSQQLGKHEVRYSIYPHKGDWDEGEVMQEAEHFTLPLEVSQSAPLHSDEVAGGKFLPQTASLFEIKPAELILSALKKAEDSRGVIVRLYNPTETAIRGTLTFLTKIKRARLVNMNEKPIKGGALNPTGKAITINIAPKKVSTLRLVF